jgi:hypothetical protein
VHASPSPLLVSAWVLTAVAVTLSGLVVTGLWVQLVPGQVMPLVYLGAAVSASSSLNCWLHHGERNGRRVHHEREMDVALETLRNVTRPAVQESRWTGPHQRPRRVQ